MSIESIAVLGAIRKARKGKNYGIGIDNMRILDELDRRAAAEGKSRNRVAKDILWSIFFPTDPNLDEVRDNTKELVKVCPECGSKHILEPTIGFNLNWECFDCKAEFDSPLWVQVEKYKPKRPEPRIIDVCPNCSSHRISSPNGGHRNVYRCNECREVFSVPAQRLTNRPPTRELKKNKQLRLIGKEPIVEKEPKESPKPGEIKMIQACPLCDSPNITFKMRTNNYHCNNCNSVFDQPISRPSRRRPKRGGSQW